MRGRESRPTMRLLALLVAVVLGAALLAAPESGAAPSAGGAGFGQEPGPDGDGRDGGDKKKWARGFAPGKYSPRSGPIVMDPRSSNRTAILDHIIKAVRSTRTGELIRVHSWNISSDGFVNELIRANERGVSVRVIMSEGMALEQNRDTGHFWRLKRGLSRNSKRFPLPKRLRSWARTCHDACRGDRGIAHSKYFLFSKAGRSRRVIMSTSANATAAATVVQWNDLLTVVNRPTVWKGFMEVFAESSRDRRPRNPYRTYTEPGGKVQAYFYPWSGRGTSGDRVLKTLAPVKCRGAWGNTGVNGRTRIRIAQDAIIQERGIRIARRLRQLWEQGCNIKIVYALMWNEVRDILWNTSRGPVPREQIVRDTNGDGVWDWYMHSKSMAISGHYGRNHKARIVWQGAENWSGLAQLSDEQGFRVLWGGAERTYAGWVDRVFANPPDRFTSTYARTRAMDARRRGVDPYIEIKRELGLVQ